ncbi:MAG: hypothetical protein AAFR77_23210 [Cyanobacteria bacterium J06631_2]
MHRLTWISSCCLLLLGCSKDVSQVANLPQDKFIQAYFNHRETREQTYLDPYRQIERSGDDLAAVIVEEIATAQFSIDLAVQELNLPLIAHALVRFSTSAELKLVIERL